MQETQLEIYLGGVQIYSKLNNKSKHGMKKLPQDSPVINNESNKSPAYT